MRFTSYLLICLLALSAALAMPAAAEEEEWTLVTPSREIADQIEPAPAYGYLHADGSLAISLDTAGLFAPELGLMIVHPDLVDLVIDVLGADPQDDEHWIVRDPETDEDIEVFVQYAAYNFDDGSEASAAILEGGLETLEVVEAEQVTLARYLDLRYYRVRYHHRCGALVQEYWPPWYWWNPEWCWMGHEYYLLDPGRFLVCEFEPYETCLEYFRPMILISHHYCNDCTGPVDWEEIYGGLVCAEF